MNAFALHNYRRLRSLGWTARAAIDQARITCAFSNREGDPHNPRPGDVRLTVVADDWCDVDDLLGDCFDPKANPDIRPSILERQRQAELERINRKGVVGILGEYRTDSTWIAADSCFGFIGGDWRDSGYDADIMLSTMRAATEWEHRQLFAGAV